MDGQAARGKGSDEEKGKKRGKEPAGKRQRKRKGAWRARRRAASRSNQQHNVHAGASAEPGWLRGGCLGAWRRYLVETRWMDGYYRPRLARPFFEGHVWAFVGWLATQRVLPTLRCSG